MHVLPHGIPLRQFGWPYPGRATTSANNSHAHWRILRITCGSSAEAGRTKVMSGIRLGNLARKQKGRRQIFDFPVSVPSAKGSRAMRVQWYQLKRTYRKPQGGFLAIGVRYPGVLSDD